MHHKALGLPVIMPPATVHTDAESYFGQKMNHFFCFPSLSI